MSIWAGIKYALNSTVGTKNFKPLDKLLKDVDGLVASDNLYQIVSQNENLRITDGVFEMPKKIKVNANGSIKVKLEFDGLSSIYSDLTMRVDLYVNGEDKGSHDVEIEKGSTANDSWVISINKGDEISFKFVFPPYNSSCYFQNAFVCADPKNISGITIY